MSMKRFGTCAAAGVAASLFASGASGVVINEFFADDTSTDDNEFIELFGLPGESLDGLSLIVVDGDTSGSTTGSNFERVNSQVDFGPTDMLNSSGFLVIGDGPDVTEDITAAVNTLQNGSQTYALVRTADIAFEVDDDDDLSTASVAAITANLIDAVGYIDGASDSLYFGATDISDGSGFAIDTASRFPNGVDTDAASDWFTQSTFPDLELVDTIATPGAVNIPEPASFALIGLGSLMMAGRRRK